MMNGWCKVKNAAVYAGVSDRTIENWLKLGLRVSRLPTGTRLIKYQWIDEFLEGFVDSHSHVDEIVNEIMNDIEKIS